VNLELLMTLIIFLLQCSATLYAPGSEAQYRIMKAWEEREDRGSWNLSVQIRFCFIRAVSNLKLHTHNHMIASGTSAKSS